MERHSWHVDEDVQRLNYSILPDPLNKSFLNKEIRLSDKWRNRFLSKYSFESIIKLIRAFNPSPIIALFVYCLLSIRQVSNIFIFISIVFYFRTIRGNHRSLSIQDFDYQYRFIISKKQTNNAETVNNCWLTGKKGIHPFNINHTKLKLSLNEYKISLKSIQSVQPVQWHTIHLPYLKFLSHLDRHLTNQRIHCTNAITKKIYPLFNFIISSTLSHHKFSEETHRCPRFEDLTKLSSLSLSLSSY